jgi:hypothetical protein
LAVNDARLQAALHLLLTGPVRTVSAAESAVRISPLSVILASALAALLLVVVGAWAAPASAACAWVLWQETTDLLTGYTPVVGTPSERECTAQKAEYERRARPNTIHEDAGLRYVCFPETIDPRGPQGAMRLQPSRAYVPRGW